MISLLRRTGSPRGLEAPMVVRTMTRQHTPGIRCAALPRRFSSTHPAGDSDSNNAAAAQDPTASASSPTPDPNSSPSSGASSPSSPALHDQLAQKDAQISEYKDLYIRARADFENLQKITTREKAQAKEYAIQNFARDLVSNIDVLQLALNSVPEALRSSSTPDNHKEEKKGAAAESPDRKHLTDLWGGVQSTKNLLEKTLARYGVVPFDPTGQQFDPNKHEAMYQVQVPDKEPNSVLNCSKVGWMLRDRVLRPAQVGVAQGASDSS